MSTGEDEPSPNLNGRLRPRKPATTTPSPQNKNNRKTEGKLVQDRPKRTTPSKASPSKQDDLATKSDPSSTPLFLCPYCDRKFNARQTASKHARRIHLSKQDNFIKCLYCNYSDAESNAIIKHMVDGHPNQYFACLDCHTRFPSTTELAEHKFNVCEKQKPAYRSKLRQKASTRTKKNLKKLIADEKTSDSSNENADYIENRGFNGIVISCELKPSEVHDAADIEDKITTNLILPHSKSLGNAGREKNAVIVLDDLQWNKRIPPNFSFHNTDADQILSRLGVVHRSPRVGESRKDLIRMMDEPNEKFEKCFDTSFYSKVAKNVQDNLTKYLDGSFNFNPNKDNTIKTRKSKTGVVINTAEGFPILLAHEQFSRNLVDGLIPRAIAPKHKWKWDTAENDKNVMMLLDQTKRDSHVNNCIITLISSLDIWTQLRMKSKFEGIFKTTPTAKKKEKQNIISMELKEILESRDIPTISSQVVRYTGKPVEAREGSELPAYLGLSPTTTKCELQPAVLSGEWVRPRCYVCCACGEQTRDARALSAHLTSQHPNAQVQHYEIVGETLLSADILKHLYVPPSQISNRTRPPRGFRDCTKCKKSITLEDLHQHMLDCAGDTPTVRRKCRYRPFGVRRRRPRLPDNTIRKKMRKAISSRHRKKTHMRPRPRIRTEVGDAETIRKMIADLPAKRNRISPSNVLRPRRNILKAKKSVKLRAPEDKRSSKTSSVKTLRKLNKSENIIKQNDTDNSSTVDEDDQPLKLSATRPSTRSVNSKKAVQCRAAITKTMKKKQRNRKDPNMRGFQQSDYYVPVNQNLVNPMFNNHMLPRNLMTPDMRNVFRPGELQPNMYSTYPYYFPNQLALEHAQHSHLAREQTHQHSLEQTHHVNHQMALKQAHDNQLMEQMHHQMAIQHLQQNQLKTNTAQIAQANHQHLPQVPHNQLMIDYTHQKIDVFGAGPSNIRQHSNRDDKNIDGGKTPPIGDGNEGSQNNDIAQTPNVPLKHSIASLTSHTDLRDTAALPHHPYLLPVKMSDTLMHESMDNRQNFENEETADKLDKPPIANDRLECKKPDEPLNYSTHDHCIQAPPLDDIAGSKSAGPEPFLSNESSEFRGPGEKLSFLNNSIGPSKLGGSGEFLINDTGKSECTQEKLVLPNNSTGRKNPGEQPPLLNELKRSVGLNEELIKIENDKKLNKSRKGLNDCIAMLRTKKGLRLDLGTKESSDENIDSAISVTIASNPPLLACKNIEKNDINLTPAQVFSRSALPEQFQSESSPKSTTQSVPSDLTPPQTENYFIQRRKASVDSQYETSNSKLLKAKREVCRTRSLSHSEYEQSQMEAMQTETALFVKPPPKRPSEVDSELIMRRNSVDGMPILDDPIYHHRFVQTAKTLMSINTSNFTRTMLKNKKDEVDVQLQFSQHTVEEVRKQQNMSAGHVTHDTEKIDSIADRQLSVSPTSRRTRRKPVKKNPILEQQPAFVYERSKHSAQKQTADKETAVSPLHNSSYRSFAVSTKEPNTQMASTSFLSPDTSTIKTVSLKTPPSTQVRNESNKRVLNSSETGAYHFQNHEDGSQNKIVKKSPENLNDNIMSMQHLRRHSIELANAQNTSVHNYDILMLQAYREHNEKAHLATVPSRGHSQSRQTTQNDYSKRTLDDNGRHDRSNEMHSHHSSISTFVSTTHDTHGVMHVNPESIRNELTRKSALTREIQDSRQKRFENEQLKKNIQVVNVQKEKSNEPDLTLEKSITVGGLFENKFTSRENKGKEPYVIDNSSHRLGIRRNSDYYARSSPYKSNIQNLNKVSMSDRSLEMVPDENTDNSLRAYHESVASFRIPTSRFSNAIYTGIPMQPIRCESSAEEVTPLDLSCDPKTRLDKMLDHKSPEAFKNQCEIPISNENQCRESLMMLNFRSNYSEQLRNLPQHLHVPYYKPEDNFNRDLVHKTISDELLEKTDKNNTNIEISMINREDLSNQRSAHQTGRYTDSSMSTNSELSNHLYDSSQQSLCNEEIKCKNINTDNISISSPNKLLPITPVYDDYLTPRQLHTFNPMTNYRQESMHEQTFIENKKIARCSSKQESRLVMEATLGPSTDEMIQNIESVDQYETNPNMGPHMSLNTPIDTASDISSRNNSILEETTSGESTVQLCTQNVSEDDHIQIDQDAETARKFAMLPEELVKILGTIPKDHRNQLLNVLPQYVSTTISGNSMPNAVSSTVVHKNGSKQQVENKQNSAICSDSNRLSVNTAISPSSIIPKKRHSPSQSRGRLNSNEIQTMTVIRPTLMPILAQSPQMSQDEKTENNAIKFSQNTSSVQKNDAESSLLNSIPGLVTQKPLEKDCEEAEINVVDFRDPETMNKNKEFQTPPGTTYIPPIPTQDVSTHKLYSKVKHSNEQTASLRAVRIKPTSSRKASSDEKTLFANISYKTNICGDEEYTNPTHPQFHNYRNITDFKYDKVNTNPQLKKDYNDDVMLRSSRDPDSNSNLQRERTDSFLAYNNTMDEKNKDLSSNLCSVVSQNEDIISQKTVQISNKTITLEPSATAVLHENNKVIDHFLGQMSSTTFSDGDDSNEQESDESKEELPNTISSICPGNNNSKNDYKANLKSISPPVTQNTNKIETIEESDSYRPSEVIERKQALSSETTENRNPQLKLNKVCEDIKSSPVPCSERETENTNSILQTLSPKEVKSNEDDSDDDVTLAVIKQKQGVQPSIITTDSNTSEMITKQSNPANFNRKRRNRSKITSKRRKKKILRKSEITRNNKLSGSSVETNIPIQSTNIALAFDDKEVKGKQNRMEAKTLPVNSVVIIDSDKINNEISEFDVNKENNVTENVNKIKEDNEISALPECNQIECQLDNCIDKNIEIACVDTPNINIDINLQSEEENVSATEEIQVVPDVIASCNFKIIETYESVIESQSTTKKKLKNSNINSKSENELANTTDVETENVSTADTSISDMYGLTSTPDEIKHVKLSEVSEKDSANVSDIQLCSEISEINTMPLRRSRRGKSMYVDSGYLEDVEQIVQVEDDNKKAPLTMKRLILSRVEKDKKRVSESSISENKSDTIDNTDYNDSKEVNMSCIKKAKLVKRKKSPCSKRKSKKIKPASVNQHPLDLTDHSDINSASDGKNKTLRELSHAENKIEDIDTSQEDVKCDTNSANTASLTENTTSVDNEMVCEVASNSLLDVKGSTVPGKRKLNITKISDVVSSKTKKTKYHKTKSQSDFDSDDDKVLLETKQKISAEKPLAIDEDTSTSNKCLISLEENDGKPLNVGDGAIDNNFKQIVNTIVTAETRVTCYNRQSSHRRPRSSSASFKDSANYDPYDIDFEDMVESTTPIIKKKSKNGNNSHSVKFNHDTKLNIKGDESSSSLSKISKQAKIKSCVNNESDSDSSKSDVPLQKYVDEKVLESKQKNKSNKVSISTIDNVEIGKTTILNQTNVCSQQTFDSKGKKSTKRVNKDDNLRESEAPVIDHNINTNNNTSVEETTQKQLSKEKKTRRTLTAHNGDSSNVSSEVDQQLLSDKFMENFGFYSEKIPRKSNLLASKKISETFHNMVSNDIDDYGYKEKSSKKSNQNENKKKHETSGDVNVLQDPKTMTDDATISTVQSTKSGTDTGENLVTNEPTDVKEINDNNLDSLATQNIVESVEVKNIDNAFCSEQNEGAEANAAQNSDVEYPHSSNFDTIGPDIDLNILGLQTEEDRKINETPDIIKKANKSSKAIKQLAADIRNKMYPDIEEIDMFEDKFDKIKRKRRSQAVAAKQIQSIVETNTSVKPRKQTEKKRTAKSTKKNNQSTQVPTKGALKGFEGIKISIPTQDLNMPPNVSPPRQQKKRKKVSVKRRKESSESDSSCSEIEKEKSTLEKDIYEFKDSEDTELFDLRPSTVMDRFRSMHNKNKFKQKERDKGIGDIDKEKPRAKSDKKTEAKDQEIVIVEREQMNELEKYPHIESEKRQKKTVLREEGKCIERGSQRDMSYDDEQLNIKEKSEKVLETTDLKSLREKEAASDISAKTQKYAVLEITRGLNENRSKKDTDDAIASTSGIVSDRMDESDYESELSSPEGEFIFYTSDDVNCICPSDNDSDESDVEKGCGRPNCLYKNRNADKNAAIGNIFKNNAVRCEKTDTKGPEKPKPNLDQLFDSLFEIKPNNCEISAHQKEAVSEQAVQSLTRRQSKAGDHEGHIRTFASPVSHHDPIISKQEQKITSNKDIISICDENFSSSGCLDQKMINSESKTNTIKNIESDKKDTSKYDFTSNNEIMSDSDSLHIFTVDDKLKDNFGYSLVSEECTQVNFADIIADEIKTKNGANKKDVRRTVDLTKTGASDQIEKYNSEDDFDINKPESLTKQYMHFVLPADKATCCAQTEHKSDNSDSESGNESAATKYLKGLSPSEAAKLEIYTMVCAQSTQTVKREENDLSNHDHFSRSKSEDKVDIPFVERTRIRLQKYDIREIAHKSKSSKSIQTEKNKSCKSSQQEPQVESDDDNVLGKLIDHVLNEPDSDGSTCVLNEAVSPPEETDSFATPASRLTAEKHTPRKSDEGISTSHDYSADAFDQASYEDTGVARQRARRKCTVGKQNILAEHWSSESEFDSVPPRRNSADSVVANVSRKKKSRKKEGHHSGGKRGRHTSKNEGRGRRTVSGGRSDESDSWAVGPSRAPPGPKIRARAAHHYWSSDSEEASGPQPQHGWIVGDSHKKLVTMLAHAKGRKRNNGDKHFD